MEKEGIRDLFSSYSQGKNFIGEIIGDPISGKPIRNLGGECLPINRTFSFFSFLI